jgi:hypothetical protein
MATAKFYVYTLTDPRTLQVFYIGKGTAARSYAHTHKLDVRETDASPKARKVREIVDAGEEVIVNIIKRFEFENDAYEYEAELIAKTPNLLNSVAGGGGDRAEITKANDGKNYSLTPKQEKFSQLIAAGDKSYSDCYRIAYDTERMNDKQIHEEASKLSSHPKVTQRVEQINAPVINKTQIKREDIIVSLQRAVDLAEQTAQTGAMVSALRELGKLIDAYPAEKKELTVSDDIVARIQEGRQRAIETMILVSEEEPPTPEEIN